MDKGGAEVAFLAEKLRRGLGLVVYVLEIVAVDLLGHVMDIDFLHLAGCVLFAVIPGEVHDRLGELAALFLVKRLYAEVTVRS